MRVPRKFSKKVTDIAFQVGQYYLEKNGGNRDKAIEEINSLGLISIEVEGDRAVFYVRHPGVLIGWKGLNIGLLRDYIDCPVRIEEVDDINASILAAVKPPDLGEDCPEPGSGWYILE